MITIHPAHTHGGGGDRKESCESAVKTKPSKWIIKKKGEKEKKKRKEKGTHNKKGEKVTSPQLDATYIAATRNEHNQEKDEPQSKTKKWKKKTNSNENGKERGALHGIFMD